MVKKPKPQVNEWGDIEYLENGLFHREDGPAVIHNDGTRRWYQNGVHKRDDGPAIEWADGTYLWIAHGIICEDINEWGRYMEILNTEDFTMIKLQYG